MVSPGDITVSVRSAANPGRSNAVVSLCDIRKAGPAGKIVNRKQEILCE